ncbi:hypothetical protein V6U89_00505 [Micromonospora sp. CPCC 206171]|uniref:hypothetical protein n=1 Tax=Micromonospora sp. CPCC 206171 TaxID=3122405 RepID=UPI002FF25CB3
MTEAGVGFSGALAGAYRPALRHGLLVVGTDLVLWSALVRTRVLGRVRPDLGHPALRAVRRGRSELNDPEPPQRSRLAPGFDEDIALLTEAELREAAYRGADLARARAMSSGRRPPLPAFTPGVRHAVYEGLHEGARAGLSVVGPAHLTVGLLTVPDAAAVPLLTLMAGSRAGQRAVRGGTPRRPPAAGHPS